MNRQKGKNWIAVLLAVLMACSLLAWPVLAAAGDGSGSSAGAGTESAPEGGQESEKELDDAEDPAAGEEDGDPDGGEETDGEGNSDPSDTEDDEEEPEEPEPTLEELRNELMAIMGGGEASAGIQANIDRLIALGDPDGNLRTYLEGMIRLHQLRYEEEQLQATLEQLEAANASIGAIGEAMTALENPDEILQRIEEEISDQAARLLESAGYDGTGDLALVTIRALDYLDGGLAGGDSADMAAILLFQGLIDSEVLNEAGLVTASDAITAHFSAIAGRYRGLAAETRQSLADASQDIAGRANNAAAMDPGGLVAAGVTLQLTNPVFTYSGTTMVSLKDAAVFLGGEVVEMGDNATVVIQAPGVVLEMTRGSSDAYLGDKLLKMEQPVLSFDKVCYLPLDTVLRCCGMERMTVGNYTLLYAAPES